jgi:predicted DNA-binding transcriptional regulator AlpA
MTEDLHHRTTARSPFIGTAEAARYLGYSENHLRALMRAGKVPPPIRIAGKWLWRESILDEYLRGLESAAGITPGT